MVAQMALFVLLISSAEVANHMLPGDDEKGFKPLFGGTDLNGWVTEGDTGFVAKNNMIVCTGSGNWPNWLRSEEQFENFVLRLEYKTFYGAESGIFFHAPDRGRISEVGFELQIGGSGRNSPYSTGAIVGAVPPLMNAARRGDDEEFDRVEIHMEWPHLKVTLNDRVIHDLDCRENELLKYKPRFGFIGFQDRGKPVHFRNIRIKPLPDSVRHEWKTLLTDSAMTELWKLSEKCTAEWKLDNGVLKSSNGHGYLILQDEFENCEFQTYFKTTHLANGGVFFRWNSTRNRGFEIQIEDIPDSNDPTGSIYNRSRATSLPYHPGEWVLLQVFLKGKRCVVRLNGVVVAENEKMGTPRVGNLSLQMHRNNAAVFYRGMMLRKLPVQAPVPVKGR